MTQLFPLTLDQVIVRRRGQVVLGPIDLTVSNAGPTIVIGPNGSGKTTLLRVMHGIERMSGGTLAWQVEDASRHAFVFQSPIVMRRSTADNLAYPLQLVKTPKAEIAQQVDHWLNRIGLHHMKRRQAARLSGGERQKLAIARALIRKPEVLFLDEPCANLDGHATRDIETLLQEAAATGTRLVMATHDMGQARRLARDVVFMLDGKVHETCDVETAFGRPATKELAAFLKGDIVT